MKMKWLLQVLVGLTMLGFTYSSAVAQDRELPVIEPGAVLWIGSWCHTKEQMDKFIAAMEATTFETRGQAYRSFMLDPTSGCRNVRMASPYNPPVPPYQVTIKELVKTVQLDGKGGKMFKFNVWLAARKDNGEDIYFSVVVDEKQETKAPAAPVPTPRPYDPNERDA